MLQQISEKRDWAKHLWPNKEAEKQYKQEWRRKNLVRYRWLSLKHSSIQHNRKHAYPSWDVFKVWYPEALIRAAGFCECCHKEEILVTDHAHDTGQLRGLICNSCNRIEGLAQDNEQLSCLISYRKKHGRS